MLSLHIVLHWYVMCFIGLASESSELLSGLNINCGGPNLSIEPLHSPGHTGKPATGKLFDLIVKYPRYDLHPFQQHWESSWRQSPTLQMPQEVLLRDEEILSCFTC